jgi:tetratricopeptide (TPR) repeat protein
MPPSVIPFTNNHLANWMEAYQIYSGLISEDTLTMQNYPEKDLEDIARVLMTLKDTDAAEVAFQEILKNNPDNIQAKAHLVEIYGKQKRYDKAIDILEDWVNQNPKDVGAQRRLEQYKQLQDAEAEK